MVFFWISIAIVVFLILITMYYFNKFVLLGNRIDNSLAQIDVQLKKRADLIPSLIKTIKGYVKHESKIMKQVTDARKSLVSASSLSNKMKAGAKLQDALKSIFAIAENYPNLKSNENFLNLQQELSAIEDKISYARQYYNDSILSYNNSCQTFPGVAFASLFNKSPREFLKIPKENKAVPEIDF